MKLAIPAAARTTVYVVAFTVAVLTCAALIVLAAIGVADWDTIQTIGVYVLGILGVGGHGVALLNRPTKGAGDPGEAG